MLHCVRMEIHSGAHASIDISLEPTSEKERAIFGSESIFILAKLILQRIFLC